MREMKDSRIEWIGEIPKTWDLVKYKRYCNIFAGGTPDTTRIEYYNGNIPWIQSGKIQNCDVTDCSRYITDLAVRNSSTKFIPKNTALLAMTGATCGNVGFSKIDLYANQSVMAFVNKKELDARYVYYSLYIQKEGILINQNGSAQSGISVESGKNLYMPYPGFNEQQRIAQFLDNKVATIDNIIDKTKETIEDYKKYKQSLITEVVTKGLDKNAEMKDSGVEWIGKIPKGWRIYRTKECFEFSKGLPITKADLIPEGERVINYGQIHSKDNIGTEIKEILVRYVSNKYLQTNMQSIARVNDFVFADTSEDLEGCGNFVYVNEDIFAGYHTIILRPKDEEDMRYLAYGFLTDCWRSQLRSRVYGVKVYSITQKILKETTVLLPSEKQRDEIVEYLTQRCAKIDEIIKKKNMIIDELEQYKKSLIYEYVTGKKEVR